MSIQGAMTGIFKDKVSPYAVACILCIISASPQIWQLSPWLIRFIVVLVFIFTIELHRRLNNLDTLSYPIFLLPAIITIFYSLGGAIVVETLGGATPISDPAEYAAEYARRARWDDVLIFKNMRLAYGSTADLMVQQFSLGLFAAVALMSGLGRAPSPPDTAHPRFIEILAVVALVAGAVVSARLGKGGTSEGFRGQLGFLALPATAFAVAQTARWWALGMPRGALLFATVVMASWAAFFEQGFKPLALMLPSCLILIASHRRLRRKTLISATALVVALSLTTIIVRGIARGSLNPQAPLIAGIARNIASKAVFRQAETMFCLTSAANAAALAETENRNPADPGYFLGILVPRALWPEKPNYSQGSTYAVDYCLFPARDQALTTHSASITLLGEPLLHGGKPMLGAFSVVLTIVLMALAVGAKRGPPHLATAILALSGWLMDFDQLAAIYIGNMVKVAMVLALLSLAFHHLARQVSRPGKSAPKDY